MTDTEDREERFTSRLDVAFTDPEGSVLYAEVYDADRRLAGYFWITENVTRIPRAGILLAAGRNPDEVIQDDLGEVALNLRESDSPARDVMEYLAATRDGQGGKALIVDFRNATGVSALRSLNV